MKSVQHIGHTKLNNVINEIKGYSSLAVAFSGGVDSTLLLAIAIQALGDKVLAITAVSPLQPSGELESASKLAKELGAKHVTLHTNELEDPQFLKNTPDRCFYCKRALFGKMMSYASEKGYHKLAHGLNLDDFSDYRPGIRAADELGVLSPLAKAEFSKKEIRGLAQSLGLSNWNRPAMACLATRIPYGTVIDQQILRQVDAAEQIVRKLGIIHCRVRHYGNLARIEANTDDFDKFIHSKQRSQLVVAFKSLGYHFVALDLEGYKMGKMNQEL